MTLIKLNLKQIVDLTDRQFVEICQTNRDYKFERTVAGELLILRQPDRQIKQWIWSIASQLWTWNQQTGLGGNFDSLTAFKLPNGAIRSPHLAWIHSERWSSLTLEQREPIVPLCPDFAIELLSADDHWETLQQKMQDYQEQGTRLGWLIDPIVKKIEIYHSGQGMKKIQSPDFLSGENVLPGFVLDMKSIFQ